MPFIDCLSACLVPHSSFLRTLSAVQFSLYIMRGSLDRTFHVPTWYVKRERERESIGEQSLSTVSVEATSIPGHIERGN